MPTVTVGDIEMAYETSGPPDGPALLAIMGLTGSMGHWRDFPQRFADRHRVIAFDNRGAGRTSAPAGAYSTAQLARDALGLLDALGVDEAHVFGVSMGGMIALELALQAPARVKRLVLGCATHGGPASSPPEADVIAAFGSIGKGNAEATVRRLLALNFGPRFLEERTDVMDQLVAYGLANRMTPAGFHGQLAAVAGHDVTARVSEIEAPTLVVTGSIDRLIPPRNARLLGAAIPRSRVVELEGIGHMFWVEAADAAEQAMREFLEEGSGG